MLELALAAGAAPSPTVTLTYTAPAGYRPTGLHIASMPAVDALPVVNGSQWTFTFTAPPNGTYARTVALVKLDGTGATQDSGTITFPYTNAFNIADLKKRLNYLDTQTQDDAELAHFLDAAVEIVEGECGPINPRTFTETVVCGADGKALLTYFPAVSVSGTGWLLPGGVIGGLSYGPSTVTYIAGRGPTAAQIEAVYAVAGDLFASQRGQGTNITDDGQFVVTPILTRRVRELLGPTRIPSGIA